MYFWILFIFVLKQHFLFERVDQRFLNCLHLWSLVSYNLASFYLALYWAEALANQEEDAELKTYFAKVYTEYLSIFQGNIHISPYTSIFICILVYQHLEKEDWTIFKVSVYIYNALNKTFLNYFNQFRYELI